MQELEEGLRTEKDDAGANLLRLARALQGNDDGLVALIIRYSQGALSAGAVCSGWRRHCRQGTQLKALPSSEELCHKLALQFEAAPALEHPCPAPRLRPR